MKRKTNEKKMFNIRLGLQSHDIKVFSSELKKLIVLKQKIAMQLIA